MVNLDSETIQELVELLKPFMEDEQERRPFLIMALGNNTPVLQRINWGGNVEIFTTRMIDQLAGYGEVSPGRQALWILLQYVRSQVGTDRMARIDKLCLLIDVKLLPSVTTNTISLSDTEAQPKDERSKIQIAEEQEKKLRSEKLASAAAIERAESKLALLEKQLKRRTGFREAIDWVANNRKSLARKAGDYAWDKCSELIDPSELNSLEKKDRLYWEIDKHLELIYRCLMAGRPNLLDEPTIPLRQDPTVYKTALEWIKSRVPQHMPSKAATKLKNYLEYLKSRL